MSKKPVSRALIAFLVVDFLIVVAIVIVVLNKG